MTRNSFCIILTFSKIVKRTAIKYFIDPPLKMNKQFMLPSLSYLTWTGSCTSQGQYINMHEDKWWESFPSIIFRGALISPDRVFYRLAINHCLCEQILFNLESSKISLSCQWRIIRSEQENKLIDILGSFVGLAIPFIFFASNTTTVLNNHLINIELWCSRDFVEPERDEPAIYWPQGCLLGFGIIVNIKLV